jgi:cobalt/nickel transport system permease protein
MNLVERVQHTNAWSRRHPGGKLLLGSSLLLLSMVLPVFPGALLVLASVAGAVLIARIRAADYLRVLAAPLAFLLTGAVALMVTVRPDGGPPWFEVSMQSIAVAAEVTLRALAATASLLVIVLTIPLPDLLGLLKQLRVPGPILDITLLTHRFATLAIGVAERTRLAQANRLGYSGVRSSIRSTGALAAALLPRVLDRARRMETGLATRAYAGELRTLSAPMPLSLRFVAAALALDVVIVAVSFAWRTRFNPLG